MTRRSQLWLALGMGAALLLVVSVPLLYNFAPLVAERLADQVDHQQGCRLPAQQASVYEVPTGCRVELGTGDNGRKLVVTPETNIIVRLPVDGETDLYTDSRVLSTGWHGRFKAMMAGLTNISTRDLPPHGNPHWSVLIQVKGVTLDQPSFTSPAVGWAENGETLLGPGFHRTSDGGQRWKDITPKELGASIKSYAAVSDTVAWVLGASGNMFLTTDGGTNWSMSSPGLSPFQLLVTGGNRISAVDGQHAWLASLGTDRHSVVSRTTDGGRTWQQTTVPNLCSSYTAWLSFASAQHGYLLSGGPLFVTQDGGASWYQETAPGGATGCNSVTGLVFNSPQEGTVLAGTAGQQKLYRTHDGGQSWQPRDPVVEGWPAMDVRFGALPGFVDSQHGWGWASGGALLGTNDDGVTWHLLLSAGCCIPTPTKYSFLHFVTASIGFAFDAGPRGAGTHAGTGASTGTIRRSTDGGRTWTALPPPLSG